MAISIVFSALLLIQWSAQDYAAKYPFFLALSCSELICYYFKDTVVQRLIFSRQSFQYGFYNLLKQLCDWFMFIRRDLNVFNIEFLSELLSLLLANSSSMLQILYYSLSTLLATKVIETFSSHFCFISCIHLSRLSNVARLVESNTSNIDAAFLHKESASPVKPSCLPAYAVCPISHSWHLTWRSLTVIILEAKWIRWVGTYLFSCVSSVNCWIMVDLPTPMWSDWYLYLRLWRIWKGNDNGCSCLTFSIRQLL